MSGTTSVPTITIGPNGVVIPAESAILAGAQADINAAMGGKLNPALTTPQGQLASSLSATTGDKNDQLLQLFNNMDPAYASGRMQDGIARIYFLGRNPAQSTVLQVACGGLTGVQILVGALVRDQAANLYVCTQAGEIPASGSITLAFAAVNTGPTPVPATVDIYQALFGWNTAAVVSGALGNVVESRSDFEFRRQNSVSQNASGILPAVLGKVLSVSGVLDAFVTENNTSSPVTTRGVTLARNSLYVCVAGGAAADIANAIWSKKNPGCGYTGNTAVTISDTVSGYSFPLPQYLITWQTAAFVQTAIQVTLVNSATIPDGALTQIQTAVLAAFTGADGGKRARIASTVLASRFYGGVIALGAWAQIIDIQLGSNAAPGAIFAGAIASGVLTVSSVASGALAVGQSIFGASIAAGTVITSLGTGTGGTGTYNVSSVQTTASETMSSVAPNQNSVTLGIGQFPTLAALDVSMVTV